MAGRANLRKKEKTNGLEGAKNRGRGKPTYGKERKRMISRGSKQGARRANLRKREKTDGLLGLKQGAGWTNLRKKEKTNGLVRAKTGRGGGPT